MPIVNELLQEKRQEILQIAAKHGAYNVRVFLAKWHVEKIQLIAI